MKTIEEKARAYDEAVRLGSNILKNTTCEVALAQKQVIPALDKTESEDERTLKWLIAELHHEHDMVETDSIHPEYAYKRKEMLEKCIIYLEKQKEQNLIMAKSPQLKEKKSLSTEETELNSIAFLEQLGYTCIPPQKQAPVAFTKEDEVMWQNLIGWLEGYFGLLPGGKEKFVAWLKERFVKFAYPKPGWKPNEEQMNALLNLKFFKDKLGPSAIGAAIDSLYEDLEKLIYE